MFLIPAIFLALFSIGAPLMPRDEPTVGRIPTDRVQHIEGKRLYVLHCIRCHNSNPTKPGVIGPELYTTPLEVFRTKVPTGTYPIGYISKRRTKIMPKFPQLTNSVDKVYDYIQSVKGKQ